MNKTKIVIIDKTVITQIEQHKDGTVMFKQSYGRIVEHGHTIEEVVIKPDDIEKVVQFLQKSKIRNEDDII